jgi:hypothetical protein
MPKHLVRLSGAIAVVFAAISVTAPLVQAQTPDPRYSRFAGCPSPKTEYPGARITCVRGTITGGHSRLGKAEVPFSVPVGFSGGVEELFEPVPLLASPSGGLEPVKQPVPLGSTKLAWLANILGPKLPAFYAVSEIAGAPTLDLFSTHLPIRVHLVSSALNGSCYIGSAANPIVLNLTTGTTSPPPPAKPITGDGGVPRFEPELEIQSLLDRVMVDNTFAVPAAGGCALKLFGGALSVNIDKLLNSVLGLPAPAGASEVVQKMDMEIVDADFVYP